MMRKCLLGFAAMVVMLVLIPVFGGSAFAYSTSCPVCGNTSSGDHDYTEAEYYSETKHAIKRQYWCDYCEDYFYKTEYYENHNWEKDYEYDDYKKISSSQHSHNVIYRCSGCLTEKTVTEKDNHKWVHQDSDNYKYISSSKHSVRRHYECKECGAKKTKTVTEKHRYSKYSYTCLDCNYPRRNRSLKLGKWTYYSGRPWLKLRVKKDGYIKLRGSYDSLGIYNKAKNRYREASFNYLGNSNYQTMALKKGIYYLRPYEDDGNCKLKVTAHKLKNKHNYSEKTAVSVPRNKYKLAAVYAKDKKKTWHRYYKSKITKNRRIYIWGDMDNLYTDKGERVSFISYDENKSVSEYKLKKGTYYFYVGTSWNRVDRKRDTGELYRFKWNYR